MNLYELTQSIGFIVGNSKTSLMLEE